MHTCNNLLLLWDGGARVHGESAIQVPVQPIEPLKEQLVLSLARLWHSVSRVFRKFALQISPRSRHNTAPAKTHV
eukprot:6437115-Amphidinium_carterae.1